jgi:hypothetical protein
MAGIPARSRGRAEVRARGAYSARRLLLPVQKFVHTEVSGGMVLFAAALAALVWANSRWAGSYDALWNTQASVQVGRFLLAHSLRDWVNDALMVIFFFVVGLEVKREFLRGELGHLRRAGSRHSSRNCDVYLCCGSPANGPPCRGCPLVTNCGRWNACRHRLYCIPLY